jgi:hypothetical protein
VSSSLEAYTTEARSAILVVLGAINTNRIKIYDGVEDVTKNAEQLLNDPRGERMGSPEIEEMLRDAAENAKTTRKDRPSGTNRQSDIVVVSDVFEHEQKRHQTENLGYFPRASSWLIGLLRGPTSTGTGTDNTLKNG